MLALAGCAQSVATPQTNAAAARVLDRLGITLLEVPAAGCCGAVSYHLAAQEEGLDFMRRNIDAWWPAIEAGCEAIVMTASGCGAMVQEYGHLLRHDPAYAQKAQRISEMTQDIAQVLLGEDLHRLQLEVPSDRVAVHCPCTLQHAMQQGGVVEQVLRRAGFDLAQTEDNHLCCGSAGTYSILQPELSQRLLNNKLRALTLDHPQRIVTSNIGCQLHLAGRAEVRSSTGSNCWTRPEGGRHRSGCRASPAVQGNSGRRFLLYHVDLRRAIFTDPSAHAVAERGRCAVGRCRVPFLGRSCMKEFMYSLALCLLLSAGWVFSHLPSDEDIHATRQSDPALADTLVRQHQQMQLIAGGALVLGGVLGVVGFFAKSRRQVARQQAQQKRHES